MEQVFRSAAIALLLALVLGCSPSPSPAPTESAEPTNGPSPSTAANACVQAAAQLRTIRGAILAEIAAPPPPIDPGFIVPEFPEHIASGVRITLDHASCFGPQTMAAWRDAKATIENRPSGMTRDDFRAMFEALPTEPIG